MCIFLTNGLCLLLLHRTILIFVLFTLLIQFCFLFAERKLFDTFLYWVVFVWVCSYLMTPPGISSSLYSYTIQYTACKNWMFVCVENNNLTVLLISSKSQNHTHSNTIMSWHNKCSTHDTCAAQTTGAHSVREYTHKRFDEVSLFQSIIHGETKQNAIELFPFEQFRQRKWRRRSRRRQLQLVFFMETKVKLKMKRQKYCVSYTYNVMEKLFPSSKFSTCLLLYRNIGAKEKMPV